MKTKSFIKDIEKLLTKLMYSETELANNSRTIFQTRVGLERVFATVLLFGCTSDCTLYTCTFISVLHTVYKIIDNFSEGELKYFMYRSKNWFLLLSKCCKKSWQLFLCDLLCLAQHCYYYTFYLYATSLVEVQGYYWQAYASRMWLVSKYYYQVTLVTHSVNQHLLLNF